MVKLAKGAKAQGKPKKAPPPKAVEDSEEEDMEESEEEVEVPVKTPSKKASTPAKATPGKKAATPAKAEVTPRKKGATPAGAKNGKKAKKEESEDEEDFEEESEEEKPVAKKPAAKKPVAKKEEDDEEEEDEDDDEEDEEDFEDEDDESEEEETPTAKKPVAKKPAAKKPAKKESEDEEDDEEELMEVTPPVAKGKKAVAAKEDSEEEDDEDDDDEEEDEDDDDDEEDEEGDEDETVKDSGKRKKEMLNKATPEAKKQKTEASQGLSIFVSNLNSSKDYDELKDSLREFFGKKSLSVQDVRIGVSRKFGYVDFSTIEEVEQALQLTGKKILGSDIKIEKANSPAEKNKSAENRKERDSRTLFVKNLPYSAEVEHLQEIFENAKEIRLLTSKDGSSKGIAYVEFNSEAEADKAIQEKQGTELEGRSMFIDYTGEKSNSGGRRGPGGPVDVKVLVVNNLAYSATEDSLQEVFEKATSIRIPQNHQGRPKGFAFVEFSTAEDAKDALESHNNEEIEGRSIRIEFSQGGGSQGGGRGSAQSKTLFVKGLSEDTTEETLKEAFDGSVNARIVTDRDTGTSKGFGFVDFSSAEDAKAAKEAMEDGEIDGSKVTLDFAKPKGEGQRGGRGGFGGRGGGRGGFGGRGGGRGGFGGRGGGRGGFGGRGRGGFGGRGGGGFRGGNQGKKMKFDD